MTATTPNVLIPPATPATPDLICWLWAAFPPKDGRLHVARIADGLSVSPTTIRRWIQQPPPRHRHQRRQLTLVMSSTNVLPHDVSPVPPLSDLDFRRPGTARDLRTNTTETDRTGHRGVSIARTTRP